MTSAVIVIGMNFMFVVLLLLLYWCGGGGCFAVAFALGGFVL
jgi:hypothetical protein